MEIEFALTEEDILIFTKHQLQRSPVFIRQQRRLRFGYLIGFTLLALGTWLLEQPLFVPSLFLGLAVILFLVSPRFQMWRLRQKVHQTYQQENYRATLGVRTLKATDEGLEEISTFGEVKVKWEAVDGITEIPDHCLISIQQFPAMIIPKNQVDPQAYKDFVQACRNHAQGTISKLLELKRKQAQ